MSLWATLRFIWTHPIASRDRAGAIARWTRWHIGSRILPGAAVVPFVDGTVLLVQPGMTGATGNIYVGLHEFADMAFLLHCLREDDRFVDVGANVGTYTVLASGVRRAQSVAVEPLPATFDRLCANVRLNGLEGRVRALNVGVANTPGSLRFTRALDCVNHVVAEAEVEADAIEVPVTTLDDIVADRAPLVIKVDVEGFETKVFAGALKTMGCSEVRALIVELNGSGSRYGFDEVALQRQIESFGFRPHSYDPFERRVRPMNGKGSGGNTLYLRDQDFIERRVQSAPEIHVFGMRI